MSLFLEVLREKDPSSPVAYHLEGLMEAMDRVRAQVDQIEATVAGSPEELAGRMVSLQTEIFDHMGYHMKQLRRPFQRLIDAAYENIPDLDEDEEVDWPQVPTKSS